MAHFWRLWNIRKSEVQSKPNLGLFFIWTCSFMWYQILLLNFWHINSTVLRQSLYNHQRQAYLIDPKEAHPQLQVIWPYFFSLPVKQILAAFLNPPPNCSGVFRLVITSMSLSKLYTDHKIQIQSFWCIYDFPVWNLHPQINYSFRASTHRNPKQYGLVIASEYRKTLGASIPLELFYCAELHVHLSY